MMAERGPDVDSDIDGRQGLSSRPVQDDHPDHWGSVPAEHSDSENPEGVRSHRPTYSMWDDQDRGVSVTNTEQDPIGGGKFNSVTS